MTLYSDLSRLIRGQFHKHGISYDRSMPLHRLTARYFEMSMRRIQPGARRVHFSDETQASLGEISRRGKNGTAPRDAWRAVFGLRRLLADGDNVNGFLTTNIGRAAALDGLLWHYGMHHFHLGHETDQDGFVERSDHLLFAIVAPMDAYFVDVRPHPARQGIGWVSQDLLRIVHSNWPKLIEANVFHGISGSDLTDEEMQELRRKNVNYTVNIDGKAIAPLLGGMLGDGSSVLCALWASRLMDELQSHEEVLRTEEVRQVVAQNMRTRGVDVEPTLEFKLALLEDLATAQELLGVLTDERCISRDLCRRGFVIVNKTTAAPIAIYERPQRRSHEAA